MLRASEPVCFVTVKAVAVLAWITQPLRSPERDLVEHLLARDVSQRLDFRVLGQSLGWPVPDVLRALFALNRTGGLHVSLQALAPAPSSANRLAGVRHELQALAGGQGALLASRDGLCISATGWSLAQAEKLAAQHTPSPGGPLAQATLCFAREAITVRVSTGVDPRHPAWVGLARRLLLMCGAMAAHGRELA